MAIGVPAGMDLSYGGITFSAFTRSKISAAPEYSESGRVVTFVNYDIEVEAKIGGAVASDATLEDMRLTLSTPGLALRHQNIGFGNFTVNVAPGPTDSDWGPKPEMLSWTPLGGGHGAIVVWRVKTKIPECDSARYTGLITMEYEVDVSVDIDEYSTRTISGYCLCAQTHQANNRKVQLSVDAFKEKCTPDEIVGFQRVQRDWKISKSRNRADFTFKDVELASPLPFRVKTIHMKQHISSSLKEGFFRWILRFSGSANVPSGSTKREVYGELMNQIAYRLKDAKNHRALVFVDGAGVIPRARQMVVLPSSYSTAEDIFGRAIDFDVSYALAGVQLDVVLAGTRMFLPIAENTHEQSKAFWKFAAARGVARLEVPGGEEVLIDLCDAPTVTTLKPGLGKAAGTELKAVLKLPRLKDAGGGQDIPEGTSWLAYQCDLRTISSERVAVHKKLPVEDPDRYANLKTKSDATRSAASYGLAPADSIPQPQSKTDDVIQNLGSPSYRVALVGHALRLQHKPAVPRLLTINGVKATEIDADVWHGSRGAIGSVPIQAATWYIVYALPRKPEGELPNLANPQLGTDGG